MPSDLPPGFENLPPGFEAAPSVAPKDPAAPAGGVAKVLASAVLPTKGSPLAWLASKITGGRSDNYNAPGIYAGGAEQPAAERLPGEDDRTYAIRTAHEGLRDAGKPEQFERFMPVLANQMTGASGPVAKVLDKPREAIAAWLGEKAGNRNIKAAGAIQSDITRARKQTGRENLNEIGQEMGTEGLVGPTTTPTKTYERANALMDKAGTEMGGVLSAADQAPGAALNNVDLLKRAASDVLAPMKADPHQSAAADKFTNLLGKYADTYQMQDLTPSKLHEIRKNISRDLYGWRGNKDPDADAMKSALHDFRSVVSDELAKSVDRAGAGSPEWKAANRRYEVGARAEEFADKGMDRGHGNNLVSPMEALAGMTAMAGGSAAGHPGAGLAGAGATILTALARRHGSGTLGWMAQGAQRAVKPQTSSPTAPWATPEAIGAERALGSGLSAGLRSAAADEDAPPAGSPAFLEWLRARAGK